MDALIAKASIGLRDDGYAVVHCPTTEPDHVLQIGRALGRVQHHPRGDDQGIVPVRAVRPRVDRHRFDRYAANTSGPFLPHTDGTYLDGLCLDGDRVVRVQPPKLVVMQCVQPAVQGGDSVLVDGAAILEALHHDDPRFLHAALGRNVITHSGGKELVIGCPLFERADHGAWRLRFREDVAFVNATFAGEFEHIVRHHIRNPALETRIRLESRDVLIVDNRRMLHGRTPVVGSREGGVSRELRRIWIWEDAGQDEIVTSDDRAVAEDAFPVYQIYRPLGGRRATAGDRLSLGIRPDPSLDLQLRSALGPA